ncbi:hypothetical protein CVT26_010800 [Gymnopilus dilepis]|uniref:Piwi domain-containing protein n=1 Tax=Gymnopilus dilepis TaxID=231916 RepID=A0A409VIE3_9AGAR|nr:hypothetical protein CVT26_010800 [Gymnopilus dilepis]
MSRPYHQGGGRGGPPRGGGPSRGGGPPHGGPGGPQGGNSAPGPRALRLVTNSFEITRLPTKTYHQYAVISPPEKIRNKCVQLFHHLQVVVAPHIFNPRAIYDGKAIAYSPGLLNLGNNNSGMFYVQLGTNQAAAPGTRGVYQITLTLTVGDEIRAQKSVIPEWDLGLTLAYHPTAHRDVEALIKRGASDQKSIVATNLMQLIIRQGPNLNFTNNGRAYFTEANKLQIPRSGLELWRGIFQSVRPSPERMILTIDTCTAAVYESGQMIDIVMNMLGISNARQLEKVMKGTQEWKKLESHFVGRLCEVVTGRNGGRSRTKTIRGLVNSAGEYTFDKDGQDIQVQHYFLEAYGIKIRYPTILGVKLSKNLKKPDVVPLELCTIKPGQLYKKKLPEEYTSDMVRFATMKPYQRRQRIEDGVQRYRNSEFVVESGMVVNTRAIGVDAKLLKVPDVLFKNPAEIKNGGWNALRQQFFEPAQLLHWAVIDFSGQYNQTSMGQLADQLTNSCKSLGMRVEAPKSCTVGEGNDVAGSLNRLMGRLAPQGGIPEAALKVFIIIVILPTSGAHIKATVKNWGDVEQGIHTQCLRQNKLQTANNQYWNNIALKVNARLGGANFRSMSPIMNKLMSEPYMIMGADVGHPGPGVQKPSVVGVVYSHDRFATRYAALTGIQAPRNEEISNLGGYLYRAIEHFGNANNAPPKRIIFFRDGLSEGEFENAARKEMEEIRAGIAGLWKARNMPNDTKPQVTFIVVGKRHHAVFFPENPADADRTGNSPAGSLIDGGVTHPSGKDFYLQSHAAIQGTCRSSHYTILHDEIWNWAQSGVREIQELAYTLCHVYAKATRSVSIPAPVYYADLVCSRGIFHVQPGLQLTFDDNASVASGSSSVPFDIEVWKQNFKQVHPRLAHSMYFL